MRMILYVSMVCFVMTSCMFRPPRDQQPAPNQPESPIATAIPAESDALGATATPDSMPTTRFQLSSTAVKQGGELPALYTCDGESATVPLAWRGAPTGTVSYALIMHHVAAPDDIHWYWVLYNIPADVAQLAQNSTGIGTLGTNSVNERNEYAPPCSKGPGPKKYTYTLYALSAPPQLASSAVDRDTLLAAIADTTLATATLDVVYSRP